MKLSAALSWTFFLDRRNRVLSGEYGRTITGTSEARPKEKAALALAEGPYSQALGLWYAGEKFSPEAKADVEHKVATMIEVYKARLEKADWLAPETREKAIVKLNVITPHIGYPEKLPETYAKKIIDESKTLVENAQALYEISLPILGASGTNRLIEVSGTCQPIWSMPTMIRNKTKSSSQQRFCKHLSMTFINRHQLTTVESVQSLPMKSPRL